MVFSIEDWTSRKVKLRPLSSFLHVQSTCRLYSEPPRPCSSAGDLLLGSNKLLSVESSPGGHSAQNKAVDPQHNWGLASPPLNLHREEDGVKPGIKTPHQLHSWGPS